MTALHFMRQVRVVLVETRFPENMGAAARAAANFGPCPLHLVRPERWDREKAAPLATSQGEALLDGMEISDDLGKAVAPCALVVGATARTGGWRRQLSSPRNMAREVAALLAEGEEVALVFGPEDRGLTNAHLEHCNRLVTIPTNPECSSLNLAQAVLLLLYECRLALPGMNAHTPGALSRRVNQGEKELLHATLKQCLLDIDFLQRDNPDYFFLPLARLLDRAELRRHEFDLLMGLCRQIGVMTRK